MLQAWISKVKSGEFLAEEELKQLCDAVKECLVEESNVQPVSSPVTVSWVLWSALRGSGGLWEGRQVRRGAWGVGWRGSSRGLAAHCGQHHSAGRVSERQQQLQQQQ